MFTNSQSRLGKVGMTVVTVQNLQHCENLVSREKQLVINVTPGIHLFASKLRETERGIL